MCPTLSKSKRPGRMKILEVNTEKTWRGGERQTLYNIQGFMEAGVTVELLAREDHPLARRTREAGGTVHPVSGHGAAWAFLCRHGKDYDILHAQTGKAQSLAMLAKPCHRRPVVYTRRVDFVPKGLATKLKYKHTDHVVPITHPIDDILADFGVPRRTIITEIVREQELDSERARALRRELGLEGKRILATTSALVPHKDPLNMVEAIAELATLRDDFVFLHFGDGELRPDVEQRLLELNLGERYRLMGFYEDVEDFFAIFDAFVMSSQEEGLGSSVLDAFIYRVPVVSTNAGGLKESVGDHGILCPIKAPRELAAGMNRVLSDDGLKNDLVERAHAVALTVHSSERVTDQYLALFASMLEQRGDVPRE